MLAKADTQFPRAISTLADPTEKLMACVSRTTRQLYRQRNFLTKADLSAVAKSTQFSKSVREEILNI